MSIIYFIFVNKDKYMLKNSNKPSKIVKIDEFTSEYCYLLGFIWADGYIRPKDNNISIEIVKEDGILLQEIFKFKIPWNIYYRERKDRKAQMTFSITDKLFKDFLINYGYSKKSINSPDKLISELSENHYKLFIRGIFDGDGNVYSKNSSNQITITSSYTQNWAYLEELFNKLGLKYKIRRVKNVNSYSNIRISNKKDISIFYKYLYTDSENPNIGLERKILKLKKIYEDYNK